MLTFGKFSIFFLYDFSCSTSTLHMLHAAPDAPLLSSLIQFQN